jgi:hypothetical protein
MTSNSMIILDEVNIFFNKINLFLSFFRFVQVHQQMKVYLNQKRGVGSCETRSRPSVEV